MRVLFRLSLALALLAAVTASTAWSQTTFVTITGLVQDITGAVVPGASVEATHVERNITYTAESNEVGLYTLANLMAGTYNVVVKSAGFQDFVAENIILAGRDVRRVNATLSVGDVTTTIEVTEGATLIETESARISDTRSREVLRAMPLSLRRAWDYFTLTPQFNRTGGWGLRLAGVQTNQSEALLDGTTLAGSGGSGPIGPLMDRTEFVSEMRVDVAQGNAEYATLGQLSLHSRSGTNDLHGVAANYYSNNDLNSRNPFSLTKNKGWIYQWVLGVGGPVYLPKVYDGRNKTFFFWNLEIATGPVSPYTVQRVVPLNRWRAGDFSTLGSVITDPSNNNAPFPGNIIPAGQINSSANLYQERFIPKQNYGVTDVLPAPDPTYVRTYQGNPFVKQPTMTMRGDHQISDKQFIFARLTTVRWNWDAPETSFPELTPKRRNQRNMDAATVAHTYTIRPTLLNEFRFGFSGQRMPQLSAWRGLDQVNDLGFVGLAPNLPDVSGLPRVDFTQSGLSAVFSSAEADPRGTQKTYSYSNNVSWFRGKHNLKFGYSGRVSTYDDYRQGDALFGDFSYDGNFSGLDYADFLLGIPTTMSRSFPAVLQNQQRRVHGLFAQDNWRVTPKLTLNLGLRWDAQMPYTEKAGRVALFDYKSGNIVVPDGSLNLVSDLMPTGYVDVVEASQAGYTSKSLINADLNNFQPRLGFAYRPWGNRTVFRGGFGISNNQSPRSASMGSTVPFVIAEPSHTNEQDNPLVWPNVFPTAGAGGPTTVSLPNSIIQNIQVARVMQYSLTIEHERWNTGFQINYNGTGTRGGVYTRNINQPVPDERLYIDKPRLFPNYPNINRYENGAGHQYHAVTLQANRKMRSGFSYQTYFTWANDMVDYDRDRGGEDAYDRLRDRGREPRQVKRRLAGNAVCELPYGRGRQYGAGSHWLVKGLFGGWRLSAIMAFEDGRPQTVTWQGPDPTGTRYTSSSTRPSTTIRADVVGDWTVANPDVTQWFDTAGFAGPPIGRFGNTGPGIVIGPGMATVHNALSKVFWIKERVSVRFEILATNTFNHPNYRAPQMRINHGSAAKITQVINRNVKFDSGIPREILLHLRIEW